MATRKVQTTQVTARLEAFQRQFRNLDPNNPAVWPALPRYLLCAFIAIGVIAALWYFWLKDSDVELQSE